MAVDSKRHPSKAAIIRDTSLPVFVFERKNTNTDVLLAGDFSVDLYVHGRVSAYEGIGDFIEWYRSRSPGVMPVVSVGGIYYVYDLLKKFNKGNRLRLKLAEKDNPRQYLRMGSNTSALDFHGRRYNTQIYRLSLYPLVHGSNRRVYRVMNLLSSMPRKLMTPPVKQQINRYTKKHSVLAIVEFNQGCIKNLDDLQTILRSQNSITTLFLKTNRPVDFIRNMSKPKALPNRPLNIVIMCNSDNFFHPGSAGYSFRSWEQLIENLVIRIDVDRIVDLSNVDLWLVVLCKNEGCLLVKLMDSGFIIVANVDSSCGYGELSGQDFGWVSGLQGLVFARLIRDLVVHSEEYIDFNKVVVESWKIARRLLLFGYGNADENSISSVVNRLDKVKEVCSGVDVGSAQIREEVEKHVKGFKTWQFEYKRSRYSRSTGKRKSSKKGQRRGFYYNSALHKHLDFLRISSAGLSNNDILAIGFRVIEEGSRILRDGMMEGQRSRSFNTYEIGKLLFIERKQIEATSYLRKLIGDYATRQHIIRPLSIAVFGKPGSGKSFLVEEMVRSLRIDAEFIECNLSQVRSLDELARTFHRMQLVFLENKIPIVFWDEFDSTFENIPFGFLKYFLRPMQDGKFEVQNTLYSFRKAIFVFAGGTFESWQSFSKQKATKEDSRRSNKLKDFVSRIKATHNMSGIDMQEQKSKQRVTREEIVAKIINRALIIRQLWLKHIPQVKRMEMTVAHMLLTASYRSGIRSMETIIESSTLSNDETFSMIDLPELSQYKEHLKTPSDGFANLRMMRTNRFLYLKG